MAKKDKIAVDTSTEEKIKEAAKILFTQKGFSAVKTRDIATAAGINLALLNYYFRSKQKLYDLIMLENLAQFKVGITDLLTQDDEDFYTKLEKIASYYIDTLKVNPHLALFIMNEIHHSDKDLFQTQEIVLKKQKQNLVSMFAQQINDGKIANVHPMHIMANILSLIVMPFLAKPILTKRLKINDQEFTNLMEERKKLIPFWIKTMFGRE